MVAVSIVSAAPGRGYAELSIELCVWGAGGMLMGAIGMLLA